MPKLTPITIIVFFLGLLTTPCTQAQEFDLLIKGGHVLDPANAIDGRKDIAVKDGKVSKVAEEIPASSARKVVDATGLYVTPGLIDMHVHVFMGNDLGAYIADGQTSVPPDGFTFRAGVTTVVDAGSAGWRNFRKFKEQTIDRSQTRVLAMLNIVGNGMVGRYEEQDVSDMNPTMTAQMITKMFPEFIVGIIAAQQLLPSQFLKKGFVSKPLMVLSYCLHRVF